MADGPANPNQALWEKGDFTRIADTMRASGEAFVRRIGVTRGQRVLDLGSGDGTTAIPAVKPTVTGKGMYLMYVPARISPMAMRINPATTVARARPS